MVHGVSALCLLRYALCTLPYALCYMRFASADFVGV